MNKILNEIENILMNAKKRKIYYEENVKRDNDYQDGFANGLFEENENIIDELEDLINKFKEIKNGK